MMGFEDVSLHWDGEEYVVPASNQLMLVAKIEAAIRSAAGMQAIPFLLNSQPDYAPLAMAYGAALRHAGADVSDEEVYLSIQDDMSNQDANVAIKVQASVIDLISIVSPPIGSKLRGGGGSEAKKTKKPKPKE